MQSNSLYIKAFEYIAEIRRDLQAAIKSGNTALLRQYCISVKQRKLKDSQGRETLSGYLVRKYGARDQYEVIAYNNGNSRLSHCFISIDDPTLVPEKIHVSRQLNVLVAMVRTFFKLPTANDPDSNPNASQRLVSADEPSVFVAV